MAPKLTSGIRFNNLIVLEYFNKQKSYDYYKCICDCGKFCNLAKKDHSEEEYIIHCRKITEFQINCCRSAWG